MKKRTKRLRLAVIMTIIGVVVATGAILLLRQQAIEKPAETVVDELLGWKFPVAKFPLTGLGDNLIAFSNIRDPGGIPRGLPMRLKIPKIGVDSIIEDARITPDGRMDVPAGSVNVAWFALGPHPGSVGSAVIGGHFGITNGVPFVFYNLDKLRVGDKIYVVDDGDKTHAFMVRNIKSFDRNADSTTVFTSNDGIAHLNLITCEGVWNKVNDTYPLRLVIFTDAIPSEGAIEVTKPKATPKPTPKTTSQPVGESKLPSTALEISPPDEVSVETPAPEPQTPEEVIQETNTFPATLVTTVRGLFATPTDTLITSTLLIAITLISLFLIL